MISKKGKILIANYGWKVQINRKFGDVTAFYTGPHNRTTFLRR
jgi:hypothetical protein